MKIQLEGAHMFDLLKLKEMCNLNIKDRQDRQKINEYFKRTIIFK